MIPVKLVETIFRRYWAILIPVILVPMLAMALTAKQWEYQSTAVVWVSSPVGGDKPALGSSNSYLTPAQNQAQTLNDLLHTSSFRTLVGQQAGVIPATAGLAQSERSSGRLKVFAYATGVNLLTISATSSSGDDSQALVKAVIDQYLVRATDEIQRDSTVSADYYSQQLGVAQQGLTAKNAKLAEYLAAHPKAAEPTSADSRALDYQTLVSQVQSQAVLVTKLQDSLQAIQLREASAPQAQQSLFAVQDPPTKPGQPLPVSLTSRFGVPMAAAILGLMAGLGYIYVTYRTDHTIRSAEDLEGVGAALLGSVPQLDAAPLWARYTPVATIIGWRKRDFARKIAAAISVPLQGSKSTAQTEGE